ncbi:MAG TPA: hypothetical protein VKY37_13435 [Brumimicrobium sp.]|nr:hypothetical protein [Brumimicrobium sp.]
MNYSYLLKHWITTLFGSLLLLFIYSYLESEFYDFSYQMEVHLIFLLFSTVFALPTVIISLGLFYILDKRGASTKLVKAVIILTTILGTFFTLFIIFSGVQIEYTSLYSCLAILSGGCFKLER